MAKKIKEQFEQAADTELLFDVDLSGNTELEFVPEGDDEGFIFDFEDSFEDEE